MESYLHPGYDLASPDGIITNITHTSPTTAEAIVFIENISPAFLGFQIGPPATFFNIKSTLAQLGLNGIGLAYELDKIKCCAQVKVQLNAIGNIATAMLKHITNGLFVGKLFVADERRRVRDPDYLSRLFGRSDRWGRPLLSLGGLQGSGDLILDKVDGRTVAYLTLQNGRITFDEGIYGFLPTIAKALSTKLDARNMLRLHQQWNTHLQRNVEPGEILLVRTLPLHIRTVFARVVDELLTHGYHHTTANVLQPDTLASGDIYELYGDSKREITDIPLEFYTLEPYREYVFFSDRDQLQTSLENSEVLFKAFETAPQPKDLRAAVFVVKGDQLLNLKPEDWITRETSFQEFPEPSQSHRLALMVERYVKQQPAYPFLKAIEDDVITSEGVLLARHFPSPLMKRLLLADQRCLKRIYFQYPSQTHQEFFSSEDRALLHDLNKFGMATYWVDEMTKQILKYTEKLDHDTGFFVPIHQVEMFLKSTVFGIYGSTLVSGSFEIELRNMLQGLLALRFQVNHPLLQPNTPLALVTGGGPGAMAVGNKVAKELGILSCANIVDFRHKVGILEEQKQNEYIQAKMTYRLDKLVERQAEFNLDFPIFLMGGVGTDFEYCLEEVRRKVGATPGHPVLLFGTPEYWTAKVTSRFRCNLESGTIQGSEWLSNCFYCVQTAEQGLHVYREFFRGTLPIGKDGPIYNDGFVII